MPDINNAVALGIQSPPPQKPADIIAPISSLAQLSYMNANAEKVKAETSGLEQTAAFNKGKVDAITNYNALRGRGLSESEALDKSGLAGYDPAGANAILGNVGTSRTLQANQNYAAAHPNEPLAIGGPELVGKDVTNKSVAATTAKTNVEVTEKQLQLYGQVGNVMASDPSPKGREIAANLARKAGVDEKTIQQFMALPDQQYVLAGQHFQQAAMTPEKYLDVSGQAALAQGKAKAATSIEKVEPGQQIYMGQAAREAFTGAAPASGAIGQPSLGNFAPPAASAPSLAAAPGAPTAPAAVPSLGNAAPPTGSFTPAAVPATAPSAAAPAVPVRNVSAVATPSVGVNVPVVVTDAGKKYGISPDYMARTFQIESGGNPNAYNAQSKAAGPFQFVPSTGAKYLNGASPFDVAGSADAAARLAADNKGALTQALGRPPTDAELYLAHQQGATGAAKLLANPNARAGDLVGNSAIAANGGNPNAPASAFTNLWTAKFNGGVGKTIPSAAVAPNVTPTSPLASPNVASGAIAPLAASLTPPQPTPAANSAPALPAPPVQAAPVQAAAPAPTTPVQPVTSAAPPPTGLAADNVKPLTPVISGQSPGVIAEQKAAGEAYGKVPEELDKAATAAKTTNTTLDNMAAASDGWRMGKWADKEQSAREGLQAIAQTLGVKTPDLDNKIANYQDFVKQSGQILRSAAHDTSSRVGVQEMQLIAKSLPNPELSEGGFKEVATQMKGLNDFAIAKQQAAAAWKANNGGSLGPDKSGKDFQSSWNAQASPAAFILHRMSQENPAGLQNLIATMSKTPEGIAALKNMKSQMQWANDQGLFGK
jgi:Transglycosylase SLT domain